MNNTTIRTPAIVAIFMATTFVVGGSLSATMFTPSTAFAYLKEPAQDNYNKGAQDNVNGNNDNTITDQKNKQFGVQSGFDNSVGQEASNLICTNPSEICVQEGAKFTDGSSALTPILGPPGPQGVKGDTGATGPAGSPCPHTTTLFEALDSGEGNRRDKVGTLNNSDQLVCIP
jgi:hypothetical protein